VEQLWVLMRVFQVGFETFLPKEKVYANGEYSAYGAKG
jgi:hypothetical protein